jgi:nucleoside-diphosphate-sugar epimerase
VTASSTGERVLVVGGTGPTGVPLVAGLVARGHAVTLLHRGLHEIDETPATVEHLHADPYDEASLRDALGSRTFDVTFAMYGRLRAVADVLRGRTGRFLSVGGVPAYRGFMNPELNDPPGLPVPLAESAPLVRRPEDDEKGYRIVRTEEAVLAAHPGATHFRYPYLYGPRQVAPREWCIVRRVLDGRARIVVADEGLTLHHHAFTENAAHALLLAFDRPEAAAGSIYHVGDEEVLTVRQVVDLVAGALGKSLEVVSMPYEIALPARPLLMQPAPTHRVLDLTKIRTELGYRDAVAARAALARTARWLADHPPARGGVEEQVLTDPFDYAAEDALIERWSAALASLGGPASDAGPGYGLAYSGPGGRSRTNAEFRP